MIYDEQAPGSDIRLQQEVKVQVEKLDTTISDVPQINEGELKTF